MNFDVQNIANQFKIDGKIVSIDALGAGFINDTFRITTEDGHPDYILQRKNKNIFPDVPAMMHNIEMVTAHIAKKVADPLRQTLTVVRTHDEKPYFEDENGDFWAVCVFIEDSVTYERASTPALAYKGGQGIGLFQAQLADFHEPLAEVIKGFHNIRFRFEQWDATLAADAAGRKKDCAEQIEWIESRRDEMLNFWTKVESGEIPTRVTHNDTKISNILFDKNGDVLCVIDLDTVMSSTSLNDFGDAIRSYTNTGAEDDANLANVSMDIEMFRAYTEGYLSQRLSTMTQSEIDWLAFSARYITYEQVLRFFMDYLDGDKYYKVNSPEHNLVRTKAQYALLQSMEKQYDEMCNIVKAIAEKK